MLKIKLTPTGKKHEPHYRIVVMEENSKITGRATALLGNYHPLEKRLQVNTENVAAWIKKGAQPTAKVRRLLHL